MKLFGRIKTSKLMKKYSVMIRGENYLMPINGQPQKCGFFATRVVKALDPQEAFETAANSIRQEIQNIILNTTENSPLTYLEELIELKQSDKEQMPNKGFIWFSDDAE